MRSSLHEAAEAKQALSIQSSGRVQESAQVVEKHEVRNVTGSVNPVYNNPSYNYRVPDPVYKCDSEIYSIEASPETHPLFVSGADDNVGTSFAFSTFEFYSNNDKRCRDTKDRRIRRSSWSLRWRKDPASMMGHDKWVHEDREIGRTQNETRRQFNVAASGTSPQKYCIYYCGLRNGMAPNTNLDEDSLWMHNTHVRTFHIARAQRSREAAVGASWKEVVSERNIITKTPRMVCANGNAYKFLLPRITKDAAREMGCKGRGSGCA